MSSPHVGKAGRWSEQSFFKLRKLQETAAAGKFDTSQSKTTLPTLMLDDEIDPQNLQEGAIQRIHYRIKAANAVTFVLRLWRSAVDGATKPYEENLNMLWQSAAGQVSDTDYDITELGIPFRLETAGDMYYSLEWSGATGNVQGFIEVTGVTMK